MQCMGGAPHVFLSGIRMEGRCSSSFLQGHPPSLRFGHPDVTTDDTAPPRAQALPERAGAPSGSDIRVPSRVLSQRSKEERSTREGGFPCRSVGRSAPAASHRNANTAPEPVSCRSYPAAHSREREPNAPRSAQPPASNQRQKQPQRYRCALPARAPPNRQCR